MTAEGDNRVLMQKVAKELLSTVHLPAVRARIQVRSGTDSKALILFVWALSDPDCALKAGQEACCQKPTDHIACPHACAHG